MTTVQLLFSFEGRIGRSLWWTGSVLLMLAQIIVGFGVGPVLRLFASKSSVAGLVSSGAMRTIFLFLFLERLAFAWPMLALNIKRLHDRDIPAWPAVTLAALMLFGPFAQVASSFGLWLPGAPTSFFAAVGWNLGWQVFGIGSLVFAVGLFVVLGLLPGWPGANLYGPPPEAEKRTSA